MTRLYQVLAQGGPVMYILLGFSVFALAILILKLYHFNRLGLRKVGFIDQVLRRVGYADDESFSVREAFDILKNSAHPAARLLESAISSCLSPRMKEADIKAEIHRVGSNEVRDMESWLRGLAAIAHLSPLLGLLGTVLGMIGAFMELEGAGAHVDPALLAGGIWEALLTTAFGLAIAIPSMAAYYFLEGEVDRAKAAMKDAATQVLVRFNHRAISEHRDEERLPVQMRAM